MDRMDQGLHVFTRFVETIATTQSDQFGIRGHPDCTKARMNRAPQANRLVVSTHLKYISQ